MTSGLRRSFVKALPKLWPIPNAFLTRNMQKCSSRLPPESLPCRILMSMWVALIQDWLILSTQPSPVQAVYSPRLFSAPSPSVLATVQPFLQHAWASVLSAACSLVPPAQVGDCNADQFLGCMDIDHSSKPPSLRAACKIARQGRGQHHSAGLPSLSCQGLLIKKHET